MSTPTNIIDFLVNQANGVKGLADLNLPSVPHQYVQPPQARLDETKIAPQESIPIIDFTNCDDPDVQDSIYSAATNWGFFQVVNHGISREVFNNLRLEQEKVFKQPFDEKTKEHNFSAGSYRWGTPTATCIRQVSWSEAFHIPLTDILDSSAPTTPNTLT